MGANAFWLTDDIMLTVISQLACTNLEKEATNSGAIKKKFCAWKIKIGRKKNRCISKRLYMYMVAYILKSPSGYSFRLTNDIM